jgi:hypothetical protein
MNILPRIIKDSLIKIFLAIEETLFRQSGQTFLIFLGTAYRPLTTFRYFRKGENLQRLATSPGQELSKEALSIFGIPGQVLEILQCNVTIIYLQFISL